MAYFQEENLFRYFDSGFASVTKGDFLRTPITNVSLHRNETHDLIITITSAGGDQKDNKGYPAGTVRMADESIEFKHICGAVSIAKGVIHRDTNTSYGINQPTATVETYTANSVEIDFKHDVEPSYTIEWVGNLHTGWIWTERTKREIKEVFTHTINSGDAEITLSDFSSSGGGTSALHVTVSGVDLYILHSIPEDRKHKNGQIIYKGFQPDEFRKKVRNCLSFALGLPIVYYGHTGYASDWSPTFMRSVEAFSIDGSMFRLHDMPPYPVFLIRNTPT